MWRGADNTRTQYTELHERNPKLKGSFITGRESACPFLLRQTQSLLYWTRSKPALCSSGKHCLSGLSPTVLERLSRTKDNQHVCSQDIQKCETRGELLPQDATRQCKYKLLKSSLLEKKKSLWEISLWFWNLYIKLHFPTLSSYCQKLYSSLQESALTIYLTSASLSQKTPLLICQLVWGLMLCILTTASIVFFVVGEWYPG